MKNHSVARHGVPGCIESDGLSAPATDVHLSCCWNVEQTLTKNHSAARRGVLGCIKSDGLRDSSFQRLDRLCSGICVYKCVLLL